MNPAANWPTLSNPAVRLILLISIPIAVMAPFDALFSSLTQGSPWLRAAWIAALVVIGARMGERLGLRLEGHSCRSPVLLGLAAAIAVAIYVVLLDCFIFRARLDPAYAAFLHQPLGLRLMYFMPRAFNENIMYRLFGLGGLAWLLSRGGRVPVRGWMFAAAMVGAQMTNIWFNVVALSDLPISAASLTYDALRYIAPGLLYAMLYIRNGFVVAEVASVSCHIFLQPAFSLFI